MLSASSLSSRLDDFRRGLESEVVDGFARDLRREMIDSSSSSSRSRRLGFETSEPAFDRPELDRPKLNMIANGVLPLYIMVRYSRMRLKISLFVYLGIVVIGFIYVASLMLSLIDEIETMAMDVQSSRSSGVYTAMLNERWEHELEYA